MVNIQSIHPQKVNSENLIQFLSDLCKQAVKIDYSHQPQNHPIILINAVKNIIGDDKMNPSNDLTEFCELIIHSFPTRKDDEKLWKNIIADGIGLSVFTDEIEHAVMTGDQDRAQVEIVRQIFASNYSSAILELLAELAIHNVNDLGLFTFHWLRSYHFHQDEKALWSYARCMISQIFKCKLLPLSENSPLIPERITHEIPSPNQMNIIPQYSALMRLWDGVYVRLHTFRKAIFKWMGEQHFKPETSNNRSSTAKLEQYLLNGGRYFIELSEEIIKKYPQVHSVNKIIQLEALRGIAKNSNPESFQRIANCLNFLIQ
ncbi:MAG: hypothetical protein ACE5D0_05630 [Fidelibacterota bacterium]